MARMTVALQEAFRRSFVLVLLKTFLQCSMIQLRKALPYSEASRQLSEAQHDRRHMNFIL